MGEQADLILNGDVCEGCGEEMGDGPGYPRRCSSCGGSDEGSEFDVYKHARAERRQSLEPSRTEYAVQQLEKLGFKEGQTVYQYIHVDGQAMKIMTNKGTIDFWPFTGWFCGRKPIGNIKGRGIANLIKEIKKCLSKS